MCLNWVGKIAVWIGASVTLASVAGFCTVTHPQYAVYYYGTAGGLSLLIGGLISLAGSIVS